MKNIVIFVSLQELKRQHESDYDMAHNSTFTLMDSSSVASKADLSVNDIKRILSKASEALEINSRKKICE